MPNDHIYDDFCKSLSIDGDFVWLVVYYLGQLVNNDKNRVVAVALLVRGQRQSGHKVHGEVFPPMSWYRQGLQVTIGLMSDCFQSQTNVTSSDIGLDIFFQAWPIVFLADQLFCFVNLKMLYKRIIVMTTYHLGMNGFWDVWESLELKQSFDVFPALQKAPSSQHFCFFVVFL